MFDLDRVLEEDCTLEFLKFEDDEGKIPFSILDSWQVPKSDI